MQKRMTITLLMGLSVAGLNAFDYYDPDYSYNALQKARAELEAEQKFVRQQHSGLRAQLPTRTGLIQIGRTPEPVLFESELIMSPNQKKRLSGLDQKLSDLNYQIKDLDRRYKAQIYGLPGYGRSLTGEIASPRQIARSTAQGWVARKWRNWYR
jgi:hypothetical protein